MDFDGGSIMKRLITELSGFCLIAVLVLAFAADGSAQGKGKGNSGDKGKSERSLNKSDKKSDDAIEQDKGKTKSKGKDQSLSGSDNRYKGLSKKLGRSPESIKAWFESERTLNRDLTYGQFVAANMISRNHKDITAGTILTGLRLGQSIGQTLRRKGWDDDRIGKERKRLKKMRDDDDDGMIEYDDRDVDWRY